MEKTVEFQSGKFTWGGLWNSQAEKSRRTQTGLELGRNEIKRGLRADRFFSFLINFYSFRITDKL